MESSQAAVPDAAGQAPQAAPPLDDAIVVHPHFYEPPSKPMTRVDFGKQMLKYVGSGDKVRQGGDVWGVLQRTGH